ncbi:nickel-binding protein [Thermodesulfobacteriota bacterium]
MPIYMDRHEMEGATAKAVADAHQKDLKLQEKYGIKLMTYWFDESRGSAFCLIDAPAKEKVRQLHEEAHGSIPHKIVEVNPETVEAFLGRIEDPGPTAAGAQAPSGETQVDSAFRTIMFTDMKDSTAITTRLGDSEAIELFRTHNALTRDVLKQYHGREIQHTGDGFMVSFTAASQGVECAIAIQKALSTHNQKRPEASINVRIGICAGEPVEEDQRLFGSTVQLTSRICDTAEPDQILVAPVIRDLCLGKPFTFADKGEHALKGFDQPLRMYEVSWLD